MDCIHYAVIGIGLNLNLEKKEIPQGLRSNCTSVRIQTGTKCDRVAVAVRLFQVLEKRYRRLLQEGFSPIIDEWMDLSLTLGKRIEAFSEGGKLTGYPTGLDEDGGLLIRLESGITKKISVGDITVMSLGGKE